MISIRLLCAFVVLGLAAGAAVPESPENSATLVKLERPESLKNQRWGGDIFDLYRSSSCVDYIQAKRLCEDEGTELLMIKDTRKQQTVELFLEYNAINFNLGFWLGLTDITVDGQWEWNDGTRPGNLTKNWAQASYGGVGSTDCAVISGTKLQWYETMCFGPTAKTFHAICQKRL